jgi:hypothetical protein
VAPLEITSQCAGAVTVMSNAALRSGWSKQANIRLASARPELRVQVGLAVGGIDEAV